MPVSGALIDGLACSAMSRPAVERLGAGGACGDRDLAGGRRRPPAAPSARRPRACAGSRPCRPIRPRARSGRSARAGPPGGRSARGGRRPRRRSAPAPRPRQRFLRSCRRRPEDQRRVLAAEPERVAEHGPDRVLRRHVGGQVDAGRLGVRVVEVDRRRDAAVADGQDRDDRLDRARPRRGCGPASTCWPSPRSARRASPKIVRIAWSSARSPSGVEVAWALTCSTSAAVRPAFSRARRAARTAPMPPGAGSVMCDASAVAP